MAPNPPFPAKTVPAKTAPAKSAVDPRDDAFIREVDEEYRRDEVSKLASRYGRWVVLAIGIGLAALGAFLYWQAEQKRRVEATSEQFSQALDKVESGSTTEALPVLATVAKTGNDSYRALSVLTQAGIAVRGGETDKAAGLFRAVADDAKVAGPLRDAAKLKLLRLEYDKMAPAEMLKQLQPYLEGDNPWFPVAGEMAALAHMKAGNPEKAGPIFLKIAGDMRAPQSVRGRAEQMAAVLGEDVTKLASVAKPVDEPAQTPAPQTPAPDSAEKAEAAAK